MKNGGNLRFATVQKHDCGKLWQLRSGDIKETANAGRNIAETRKKPFAPVSVSDWGKLGQTVANEGRCPSGIYNPLKGVYITTTGAGFGPKFELGQTGGVA